MVWGRLSNRDHTLKTVFLLVLAPGKCQGELHALLHSICWIIAGVRTVELSPVSNFLSKTHIVSNG